MLRLEDLQPNPGRQRAKKRVGRGNASHGTYSGRGIKGQRARAGFRMPPGFEGGQTPLWKRVPKRGFHNHNRKEYACINLDQLAEHFSDCAEVNADVLLEMGLISKLDAGLKILGRGKIYKSLKIEAHKASKTAVEKIKAAGGEILLLEPVVGEEAPPVKEKKSKKAADSKAEAETEAGVEKAGGDSGSQGTGDEDESESSE